MSRVPDRKIRQPRELGRGVKASTRRVPRPVLKGANVRAFLGSARIATPVASRSAGFGDASPLFSVCCTLPLRTHDSQPLRSESCAPSTRQTPSSQALAHSFAHRLAAPARPRRFSAPGSVLHSREPPRDPLSLPPIHRQHPAKSKLTSTPDALPAPFHHPDPAAHRKLLTPPCAKTAANILKNQDLQLTPHASPQAESIPSPGRLSSPAKPKTKQTHSRS
jgi:hypothetical protein